MPSPHHPGRASFRFKATLCNKSCNFRALLTEIMIALQRAHNAPTECHLTHFNLSGECRAVVADSLSTCLDASSHVWKYDIQGPARAIMHLGRQSDDSGLILLLPRLSSCSGGLPNPCPRSLAGEIRLSWSCQDACQCSALRHTLTMSVPSKPMNDG